VSVQDAEYRGNQYGFAKIDPEPVELRPGDPFTLTTDKIVGDQTRVAVCFDALAQAVKKGETLFPNDGYIQLEVAEVKARDRRSRFTRS
jgi:pyruvate kinase